MYLRLSFLLLSAFIGVYRRLYCEFF